VEQIAIRTENLAKCYGRGPAEITVFRGLNLEIRRGESVALLGESGAGKSTLLHLLGGLDRPSEGTVYFGSKGVSGLDDAQLSEFRNREIGFVWQNQSLLPEFSALENVMMPLLIRGVSRKQAASAAGQRLEEVGLKERIRHRPGELSGGEQQRVALARALAGNPSVLLADEPTGNLDYKTGESIISLLEQLYREHNLTSLIVTHNHTFARRCDRVLLLERGRLKPFDDGQRPPEQESVSQAGTNGSNYV